MPSTSITNLQPANQRAQRAFDLIATLRGARDEDIAVHAEMSRSAVQARRKGTTKLTLDDVIVFARALDVPEALFQDSRPTILRWFADQEEVAGEALRGRGSNSQPTGYQRDAVVIRLFGDAA